MDPLTAFSLACGIIQVVDFGSRAVKTCRELHKDGSSSANEDLEEMAKHLTGLRTRLSLPDPGQHNQDELLDLGSKCSDTTQALMTELQKLKVNDRHKKRQVFGKTIKTLWKKGAIDEIEKRLDRYREILDTRVLLDLRKRFNLSSLQQSEGFRNLDEKVQSIITNLAQGPKDFAQLKTLIHNESESVRRYVSKQFEESERTLAHRDYCKRFLDSLWYPEMRRRQETIQEAHEKTFQWIFHPHQSGQPVTRWSSFVEWLESGQGTYWISGKAGSGKSTLLNYIHQDNRTLKSLKVWSGVKEVFAPCFFFWNAGTVMEKSSEGLLRSLLYQVLEKYPDLTPPPTRAQTYLGIMTPIEQNNATMAAWTERRLHATMKSVMHQAQGLCRMCVLIDGLDEFSGDQDALISLVKMIQTNDVKVCLSSRPYRSYDEAFGSSEMLRLQDLTEPDIRTYVLDKLQAPLQPESLTEETTYLSECVVEKAQGVFLWVELVVKELLRGFRNEDSLAQLINRLQLMPSDIEALYTHMLSNIDQVYRNEAAQLFQMALKNLTYSLLNVALALHEVFDEIPDLSIPGAIHLCEKARRRIPTICAGLLEVHPDGKDPECEGRVDEDRASYCFSPIPQPNPLETTKVSFYDLDAHVDFLHRTAVDFLRHSEQGKQFLKENSPSSSSPYGLYVKAQLAQAKLLGFSKTRARQRTRPSQEEITEDVVAQSFIGEIMQAIALAEIHAGIEQSSLCDAVKRALMAICQRRTLPSPFSHWCTPWDTAFFPVTKPSKIWHSLSTSRALSSSSTSYIDTADSEPILSLTQSKGPVDFIGLEVFFGLSLSVHQMLDSQQTHLDRHTTTYLLFCAVTSLHTSPFIYSPYRDDLQSKRLELIVTFLRRSGDPNIYIDEFSTTIWGSFLKGIWEESTFPNVETLNLMPCVITTKAFLENGANVCEKIYIQSEWHLKGFESLSRPPALDLTQFETAYVNITLIEEKTPLSIIRTYLENVPGYQDLAKICIVQGGGSTSEVYHVAFGDDADRGYKISVRQYSRLVTATDRYGYGEDIELDDVPIPTRLKWARKTSKLYKEITEGLAESEDESSTDEELAPEFAGSDLT